MEAPAGTQLVLKFGEALEKEVRWSFETPRPHVVQATPREGADQVDPKAPIELVFDQKVTPEAVKGLVLLKDTEGLPIQFTAARPEGGLETRVALSAKLIPDMSYTLEVTGDYVKNVPDTNAEDEEEVP